MLSLFRTNQLLLNIFLIAYIAIVRSSVFFLPTPIIKPEGIFSYEILNRLGNNHWIEPFLAMVLIFIQGILINSMVFKYKMTDEQSLFPGLFYTILVSTLPSFLGLSAALLANTFLIIAILELFASYRKPSAAANIFNAGMWIAMASLFYCSIGIFLIWTIIGLSTLRAGSLKETMMLILGFILPYFLVATVYFLTDSFSIFTTEQFFKYSTIFNLPYAQNWWFFGGYIFFFLLLAIAILSQGFYSSKRSIQIQKYQTVLVWSLIFAVVSMFFQTKVSVEHLLFLAPALGIFLTYHFLFFKRQIGEAIHLFWLAAILFLQYHSFLGL